MKSSKRSSELRRFDWEYTHKYIYVQSCIDKNLNHDTTNQNAPRCDGCQPTQGNAVSCCYFSLPFSRDAMTKNLDRVKLMRLLTHKEILLSYNNNILYIEMLGNH